MKQSLLPLAICLLVVVGPAFAEGDSRFGAVDALLAEARQAMVAAANPPALSARAREEFERKCSAGFSLEAVAVDRAAFPINDTSPLILGMIDNIRSYYECEAFSRREPDACRALPRYQPTNQPNEYESRCRSSYIRSRLIQLNVAGRRDAAKVCEALPFSAEDLHTTSVAEECDWMTDRVPDPHCQDPISPKLEVIDVKDCLAHRVLFADEEKCDSIKDAPIAEVTRGIYMARCRDSAAYRKAYQARDINRCGDSLVCRMLMGGDVCGRHKEKFKAGFCSFRAREEMRLETARALRRGRTEAVFARLDGLMEGFEPKSEPGYASRFAAYRALRDEFDQSMKGSVAFQAEAQARPSEQTRH